MTQAKRRPNGSRELLLAAARAAFAAKGFDGARVEEIAAEAGVNKQIIYYYFESKDGLFRAALEQIYEAIREQNLAYVESVKPMRPDAAIAALVERLFGRLQRQPDVIALVLEENRHKGRHLVSRKIIQSSHTPMFDYVARVLAEGARLGIFRSGVDPRQFYFDMVSLCMFYFINTYTMSAVLGTDLLSQGSMRARRKHIVECLIASVSAP
ncbi:MAG TPA: TetR/AcrR family transcriptional regulator [Burkholderiales bacterium]